MINIFTDFDKTFLSVHETANFSRLDLSVLTILLYIFHFGYVNSVFKGHFVFLKAV